MPELPDITVYLEALERRVVGRALEKFRIEAFFVLRTAVPPIDALAGRKIVALRRVGKRSAFGFEAGGWLVLHLMIGGRLQWTEVGMPLRGVLGSDANRSSNPRRLGEPSLPRHALAHFIFAHGTLTLTEAGTKRRASLHVLADEAALRAHDLGGIAVFGATTEEFAAVLTRENHTLKRALTDPRSFSGIGNAYSDEILHAARLSPVTLTQNSRPGRSRVCTPRSARCPARGRNGCGVRRAVDSRQRSPRSGRRWRCTAGSASPARCAARRCSGSVMRRTR